MKTFTNIAIMVSLLAATAAVASEKVTPVAPGFTEVEVPSAPGASGPFLHTTPKGRVTLSWVEPAGDGHRLRFATWGEHIQHTSAGTVEKVYKWGEARTVAEGTDWFVNWADVPSVIAGDDGRMAAHWLQKSGPDTYAYDLRVSLSFDNGKTWSAPITPHTDGTTTEHGFASLAFDDTYLHVVWLDGRKYADENQPDETTLRAARIDREGNISGEVELDGRTCDCCPTAIAAIDGGFIVAYRDRSPEEIRDIYSVRYVNGTWDTPTLVHADNWKINGCPVNGPALASNGRRVAVAWFTMDGDKGVVRGAWSEDGGGAFGVAVDVEDKGALGRVTAARLEPVGGARIAWLASTKNGATIDCRAMAPFFGEPAVTETAHTLTYTSQGRSSGYPRIATVPVSQREGSSRLLVAWTESGESSRLRSGTVDHSRMPSDFRNTNNEAIENMPLKSDREAVDQ